MNFKTDGKTWWEGLERQWKVVLNEVLFNKKASEALPTDEELASLQGLPVLRIAGPLASYPNTSVELTNLSGVVAFKDLTFLSVAYGKITSIQEVSGLQKLEHLFVNDQQITSLDGVQDLSSLKNIYFQNNQIDSMLPLSDLIQLENVNAANNRLTDLNGITEAHSDTMQRFVVRPNEGIKDKHIIRFQNSAGIICHKG